MTIGELQAVITRSLATGHLRLADDVMVQADGLCAHTGKAEPCLVNREQRPVLMLDALT